MEQLQYDLITYLTSVKMSSKIRVMVEGRDDKAHVSNVIARLCSGVKFKVDVAADIKGICQQTGKNNRAKIEKAHELIKDTGHHKRLLFLCDREARGFAVNDCVRDEINGHYVDGQLSWTAGHSIENYFLNSNFIESGLRYLTPSAFKDKAIALFVQTFPSAIKMIATSTLAAYQMKSVSYPCGAIGWKNVRLDGAGNIRVEFSTIQNPLIKKFEEAFLQFESCIDLSDLDVCVKLCRGHTAIVLLKRVFAACLCFVMTSAGDESAVNEANIFDSINEKLISNVLSEEWMKEIDRGGLTIQ